MTRKISATNNIIGENMLCIGQDLNLSFYYIEVPELLMPYKEELKSAINYVFYNSFEADDRRAFIGNMKARNVLHQFLRKYMSEFFVSIKNKDELEKLIQEECKRCFKIEDEKAFKKLYKQYDKGASIDSYVSRFLKEKLLDYKKRLDMVEL